MKVKVLAAQSRLTLCNPMDGGLVSCSVTCIYMIVKVLVAQSHLTLCNPMDCGSPASSI